MDKEDRELLVCLVVLAVMSLSVWLLASFAEVLPLLLVCGVLPALLILGLAAATGVAVGVAVRAGLWAGRPRKNEDGDLPATQR